MSSLAEWGAFAFGAVIGWFVYYINRYRKGDVQISDVTTLIGAIGGAAVLSLFRPTGAADGALFGAYGIGLAIGFFAYYFALVILVSKSPNFDSDWFLDGRRADPAPGVGYGDGQGGRAMLQPPTPTQIFNISPAANAAPSFGMVSQPITGPADDDPGAPANGEIVETADFETARILANVGAGSPQEAQQESGKFAAAAASLNIDISRAKAFLTACMTSHPRVTYGLGAKVPFHGAVPGKDFTKIDCSGFVREAIRLATNPMVPFPDGSVVQHDWIRIKGFKPVAADDGKKTDGAIRIAFLRPQDSASNIGHVVLIHNAQTLESHGGTGPNSRPWTATGWQSKAYVYVIS